MDAGASQVRMIPPYVSTHTKSNAERKLFKRFEALDMGPDWYCLHSLNVAEHNRRAWGELDFVIACSLGLLSVEVKGGRVSLKDGTWDFTDRYGTPHRETHGPFVQVKDTTWSLRDRLKGRIPEIRGMIVGFSVAFPDITFAMPSSEWSLEFVLDADKLAQPGGLRQWIEASFHHWQHQARNSATLDPALIRRMLKELRPNFDLVPTMRQLAAAITELQSTLSEEQYEVLDQWVDNPRLRCIGGAGSGKTMLAMEVARRRHATGNRPLIVCSNPSLASYLRSSLDESGIPAVSIDELDPDLHTTDFLVIDEGQDLLTLNRLAILDSVLDKGLSSGRWIWFMDPNNQAGIESEPDENAARLINEVSPVVRLTRNFRNTRQIFDTTRLLTGADLGVSVAGPGPTVEMSFTSTPQDQADALASHLNSLLESGVSPSEITIITMDPSTSCVDRLPPSLRDRVSDFDEEAILSTRRDVIHLSTVAGFKGLENIHVAITDVRSLDGRGTNRLYVAATRARASLWMGLDTPLQQVVNRLLSSEGEQP